GNIGSGKNTSSAIATCESLFDEARVIAVSKRCRARVMVKADAATDDDYLQRVVVIHQEIDADGNPVGTFDENDNPNGVSWVLSSRGYIMPKGVYFSEDLSLDEDGDSPKTFTLSDSKADFNGNYFFYEFNAEGICTNPGASFVIGAGRRSIGQEPKTTKERDFKGFVIWRNGRTSSYRSPGQITGVDSLSTNSEF
ncbi:MAG: hypothetical protein NWT08_05640, partial [Akkermansiaceae bacterium]|nr:hypothetical protein [Akkermansiaceae bacterium]MDP4791110.1 hypothetical protein [Verrucomicrobiales bacterium]